MGKIKNGPEMPGASRLARGPGGGGKQRGRGGGLRGAKRYQTDVLGQARCATRLARAPCTPKRVSPTGACASAPRRSQLANRSCCGPAGARGWEPARMACGLPASALFWAPRSHAWTHAAAFVQHVHFGHVWRRSSSQAGAAAPVSGSKNRSRHAPQDCPCDCVHPRTRVDAGAAPESFSARTPPLGVRRTRFL